MTKKLDREERALLDSFEKGEWKTVHNADSEKKRMKSIARATMKKNKRINIRLSERDLNRLKLRAMEEGIPYQTLISSILHKFASGRLSETPS